MRRILSLLLLLAAPARAQYRAPDVAHPELSLADALSTARERAPRLREAQARTQKQAARRDIARAPLLPQLLGTASYQRMTGNFVFRPGVNANALQNAPAAPSGDTYNFFSLGATASQLVYDFGASLGNLEIEKENLRAQVDNERSVALSVDYAVRSVFFEARARRALVGVAREHLANQLRHAEQIEAFVEAGTRPDIDLAQVSTEVANARVTLIQAENAYELAKATLNQVIGREASTDYDVADASLVALTVEDAPIEQLLTNALARRPDLAALQRLVHAQELKERALKGQFGPSLNVAAGVTDAGVDYKDLRWNWNAGVFLTWPLYQGGVTRASLRETQADRTALGAQLEGLRLQARRELEQARLGVRSALAVVEAAALALDNARRRLSLAEGRYETGLGDALELGDAQTALTDAEAQRVQADYSLSIARTQLLAALGMSQ